ncbi:hypothetical protein VKT23_016608 [Stygiomarasmius scandens]|uniref:Uncharacterized protein n=1 Tax=Marasmiellus scandens TaxID=2682957 RepID=A0ABR1IWV1_9AGAR
MSSPVAHAPHPVSAGYLAFCVNRSRLSHSLKLRNTEHTVKCLILLQMFPGLGSYFVCSKTRTKHTVSFSDSSGTMSFRCRKCRVREVDTRLSSEQCEALEQNYIRFLEEKQKQKKLERLIADVDEWVGDLDEFLTTIKESSASD